MSEDNEQDRPRSKFVGPLGWPYPVLNALTVERTSQEQVEEKLEELEEQGDLEIVQEQEDEEG